MINVMKLSTGEDVIARITYEEAVSKYRLEVPVVVSTHLNDDNTSRNQLLPYTPHTISQVIYLDKNIILFMGEPVPSLETYYVNNFLAPWERYLSKEQEVIIEE